MWGGNPVEFADVLGIAPGDLHFPDCNAAGDPLRNLLNTPDDWIHSTIEPQQFIPTDVQLSPDELCVDEFWKSPPFTIPDRITPFLRHSMLQTNDLERWTALTQSPETLEEYVPRRDKGNAQTCLDFSWQLPNLRTGGGNSIIKLFRANI